MAWISGRLRGVMAISRRLQGYKDQVENQNKPGPGNLDPENEAAST